ncbi:MAG TPA: FtsQ-type POTRA domain-containing protein [Candidatus Limnocylindria bacterium]|jgi:cell division septal protein FtsQ
MSAARPRRRSGGQAKRPGVRARRPGGHARRPGQPLRRRLRLPAAGRILALLLFSATIAALVAGVYGPWMRVSALGHTGDAFTPSDRVQAILDDYRGQSILAVDRAGLRDRLAALPTVADAEIELRLPGELQVAITEKHPAFLWRTPRAVMIGAPDGTLIAELPLTDAVPSDLRALPQVSDERFVSRLLTVGDAVPPAELRVANRLTDLDPRLIGSRADAVAVKVDYQMGFMLESAAPAWSVALGFYQLDPREDEAAADARLERQLAAIRTLFAMRPERGVSWLDARNPGKVYWTP